MIAQCLLEIDHEQHAMGLVNNYKGFTNVKGVDVSSQAVEYCRSQGLSVEKMEIMSYNPDRKYDFIIMSHVLEHLPKDIIVEMLSKIRNDILNPNGKMCLMVPNAQSNTDCYWAYEDFTHNTLFTAGSLLFVLRSAGFSDIEFLDADGLDHLDKNGFEYHKRKFLLELYITNKLFWNKVTNSSYHRPSPLIFTYELKVLAS